MEHDGEFSGRWRIAASDSAQMADPNAQRLFDEGTAAAPSEFLSEDVVTMLPREAAEGNCRICGEFAVLTREHIPPKKSGNEQRHTSHSFEEWTESNSLEIPATGQVRQGGIYGYTLCSDCNSVTGTRYGGEYQRWSAATLGAISVMPTPSELDLLVEPFGWTLQLGSQGSGGVRPGAFVRQVLSMMCTLSGSWDLPRLHPEVRRIILESSTEPISSSLALGMCLYLGPRIRIMGPQLHVQPFQGAWRWVMEVAFPPFAFLMVLKTNVDDPGLGLMMTDWVQWSPSEEFAFEGLLQVGFGWVPYPGDYRSRAAIESAAGAPE